VRLRITHIPVWTKVCLLTPWHDYIHGHAAVASNHDCSVANGTALDNVGAVAASLSSDVPALSGRRYPLSVDGGYAWVGDGELERSGGGWQEPQDIVGAPVHELGVACTSTVRETLAGDDGAEELVLPAHILAWSSALSVFYLFADLWAALTCAGSYPALPQVAPWTTLPRAREAPPMEESLTMVEVDNYWL